MSLSAQRAIGVLPVRITGAENSAVFARSSVTVMPPMPTSNFFACKSAISVGQAVGTISSFTPIPAARLLAMSTSSPWKLPSAALIENGR